MTRLRAAALAAVLLPAIVILAVAVALRSNRSPVPGPRPLSKRPQLMLLTTLPIVFPETLSLDAPPSPALKALQTRYRVDPISVTDADSLDSNRLLLMAQPQAQPAAALVDLDKWVRGGGRVLLLADPALEWPSERPLGDVLRPPFQFADTGLLAHWGLRLDAPARPGPATLAADEIQVETRSPGKLTVTAANCASDDGGLVARCRIGSGKVTVIADADFLAPDEQSDRHRRSLGLLLIELQRLEQ